MRNFFKNFKLIVPQIKNSLLPALIFACSFLGYYLYGEISSTAQHNLHFIYWITSILIIFGTSFFNRQKPLFFMLIIAFSYIIINLLKQKYSLDYLSTSSYINLCFFAPLNLIIFYFIKDKRLFSKQSYWLLLLLFIEITLCEYFDKINFTISFNSEVDSINLNSLSVLLFLILLISSFIKCNISGFIDETSLFFSSLNIFAGFYYSASSTALSIFFCAANITLFLGFIRHTHYILNFDTLTELPSRHAYLKNTPKFPMKYSLAIICLDNYSHLYKVFGYFKSTKILKMLANRLKELEVDNPIYSYNIGEFIIIFKNDNLKQSFEKLDNIRREIASSEFMISNKQKGIKITISGCVSEKKRSDNNATEVLVRARKALQKSYQFTQNLISKA